MRSRAARLDPEAERFLEESKARGAQEFNELGIEEARHVISGFERLQGEKNAVSAVADHEILGPAGPIPARVYMPFNLGGSPPIVYFHGGGFVLGDLEVVDGPCRRMAEAGQRVVVSVDYRLAPEHPYPAAVDDCLAATAWVAARARTWGASGDQVIVAGDSAGGNLAAVVAMCDRDQGGAVVAGQALLYPWLDVSAKYPAQATNGQGYLLTDTDLDWFVGHYAADPAVRQEPRCSPLRGRTFAGLPPTLLITAGFDPLLDQGILYGERLRDTGVQMARLHFPGSIHGFAWLAGIMPQADDALVKVAHFGR